MPSVRATDQEHLRDHIVWQQATICQVIQPGGEAVHQRWCFGVHHHHFVKLRKSSLKIDRLTVVPRWCRGSPIFLGLFQVIMANAVFWYIRINDSNLKGMINHHSQFFDQSSLRNFLIGRILVTKIINSKTLLEYQWLSPNVKWRSRLQQREWLVKDYDQGWTYVQNVWV